MLLFKFQTDISGLKGANTMNLRIELKGGAMTASMRGELDHHTAGEMREQIDSTAKKVRPQKLILDFKEVPFMDSSGIGLILGRYKLARELGGTVVVQHVPKDIRRMVLISPEGIGNGFATNEDTKQLSLLLSPIAGTEHFLIGTSKWKIRAALEQAIFAKETVSAELVQQYARAARFGTHAQATFACLKTRFWAADTKPAFEKLSVPFLMIWGEENRLNPTSAFDTAEKMKDFGSFALFENTGALPHMENSKAFLENLNEFLNQSHIF